MKRIRSFLLLLLSLIAVVCGLTAWTVYQEQRQERLNHGLIAAVKRNDTKGVVSLLDQGADANCNDEPYKPLPWWILLRDQLRGVKPMPSDGPTPLMLALQFKVLSDHKPFDLQFPPENLPLLQALLDHKADVQSRWGRLAEMVGGGGWLPGEWTDDTGMALCVAEGILANPLDPVNEIGQRFLTWQRTAKDVGSTISAALSRFQGNWPEAARSTPQAKNGTAAGNGSLMRTLPVALAYQNTAMMLRHSAQISAMTHYDPQAEVCCAIHCLWVQAILQGQSRRNSWEEALQLGKHIASTGSALPDTPGMSPLPASFWTRLEAIDTLQYSDLQPSGYAGYVLECLEAAVWCCLHSETLEEVLVILTTRFGPL